MNKHWNGMSAEEGFVRKSRLKGNLVAVALVVFLLPSMWLFAQEPKSTFGLIVGIDRGYTDRQVNWGSSHNRFSKLYEDTSPNYQVGFGNFAFSLFADLELARSLTGRAQIGGTFMSEISLFSRSGSRSTTPLLNFSRHVFTGSWEPF